MSRSLAILVGVSSFDDPSFKPLRFCENDVNELGRVLSTPDVAEFEVIKLHTPNRAEIVTSLERGAAQLRPEDKLLFYFAGHGKRSPAGRLYLVAKDTRSDALRGTGVPIEQVLEIMQESHSSQRVMILDCCHSGAVGDQFRGEINDGMQELARTRGTCILAASTGIQLAEEREAVSSGGKGNGIFTRHLVEGLESGSAAVKDADYVTVDSLYDFAFQRVVTTSKQTPMKWVIGSVGNIVIAKSSSGGWQSQKAIVLTEFNNLHAGRLITGRLLDRIQKITGKNWNQLSPEERLFSDKLLAFSRKTITLDELLDDESENRSRSSSLETPESEKAGRPDAETPAAPKRLIATFSELLTRERINRGIHFFLLTSLGPIIALVLMTWAAVQFNFTNNTTRVLSACIAAYSVILTIRAFQRLRARESISKFNLFLLLVSLSISLTVVWAT
ncbi:MAG: glycogen phosphorylase [Hyphomicrobiales bacterium]|jgi:hypothetical protein|nr:glycogen phosphorylase [Hyphomicrobiales bacterium]